MTNLYVDERRLLDVWREVSVLSRPEKEVALLAAVTEQSPEQCARLPVGERDRRLILLHERTFGGRYDCETRCTSCGMHLAFSFVAGDLGLQPAVVDAESLTLTEGRIVVTLHLPSSADIAASVRRAHPAAALFARCVKVHSSPTHTVAQMRTTDLPVSLRQSAIERLAALDPHADFMFELECPSCEHDNKVMFDPVVALFSQAAQFLPVVPPRRGARGTPKVGVRVQGGPGASIGDFLERLVRRHVVEAVVHPLGSQP